LPPEDDLQPAGFDPISDALELDGPMQADDVAPRFAGFEVSDRVEAVYA
jgi:hypothetical protein